MAGMFFSLEEAAAKLNVSKEKIQELVKEGRLREFSDGPNLLFKVDEVESLMSDSKILASQIEKSDSEPMIELSDDEISLAPESDVDIPVGEELTEADTAVGAEGINILTESDVADYKMTDDTMGETASGTATSIGGTAGGLAAGSLDEIDESVNLDTFGSGSGLLDLSLQADDTSLGGILDEIYTPESGGEKEAPLGAAEIGMAEEAEQLMPDEGIGMAHAGVVAAYIEAPPDRSSNTLGLLLFIPLVVVIYSALVIIGSFTGGVPAVASILDKKGPADLHMIWLVMGGVCVVALIWAAVGAMAGGSRVKAAKRPKAKKEKKVKPPKVKKEKPIKEKKKK